MKIMVVPRKWFEDRKCTNEENAIFDKWNVISVITPAYPENGFEDECVPFSEQYADSSNVLVLKFHDTIRQFNNDIVLINESDVDSIYEFIMKTKDNGKGYIIHCTKGKSRSQAIGNVLNKYFNGDNTDEYNIVECEARGHAVNSLVYKLLYNRFFNNMENEKNEQDIKDS